MQLTDSAILTNLRIKGSNRNENAFERKYITTRQKEKRMYDDQELMHLPDIYQNHPHYPEWLQRKQAAAKLFDHLQKKNKPLSILEIGCGNGWLSHYLSGINNSIVTGQDVNFTELQQAARVFAATGNLSFIYGDLFNGILGKQVYDIILFAASIQYFPSLVRIIGFALDHLVTEGELHIVDSPFYSREELPQAKQRSIDYYRNIGSAEMADYYFHHSWEDLSVFRYHKKYDPQKVINRLLGNKRAFPWVCINKE